MGASNKVRYVKPTMEIIGMMPEECLATNSYWNAGNDTSTNTYWNGSNVGWWGSPACVDRPCKK